MDAATMHKKLNRSRSSTSSLGEAEESLDGITEQSESSRTTVHAEPVPAATNVASAEEVEKLREELGEVKNQLVDITQVKPLHFLKVCSLNSAKKMCDGFFFIS